MDATTQLQDPAMWNFDKPGGRRNTQRIVRNMGKGCQRTCNNGNPCCCNSTHQHTWHICQDPACKCHKVQS
jgi:hypothetical protein